jgi:hypothetical protein
MASLYRRILGDAFESLPPVLQRFHGPGSEASAHILFQIHHGKGRLCRLLTKLARFPDPGDAVCGQVRVVAEGDRERWIREFAGRHIETVQWEQNGLLVEGAGALQFGFRVAGDGSGMRMECVRGWFCRLPLPRPLPPRVEAVAVGQEDSWWVRVRIAAPVVGLLLGYEGTVTPQ